MPSSPVLSGREGEALTFDGDIGSTRRSSDSYDPCQMVSGIIRRTLMSKTTIEVGRCRTHRDLEDQAISKED